MHILVPFKKSKYFFWSCLGLFEEATFITKVSCLKSKNAVINTLFSTYSTYLIVEKAYLIV